MCEVLLEFDDQGCISSIKTTYCTNHPACCSLVGRLSRPVRIEFGHPQQYAKYAENVSPTTSSSSPTTASSLSPTSALFGNLANSLHVPTAAGAAVHRRHVSSRSLLRTVSDVAQQSVKRSVSAPYSSSLASSPTKPCPSTPTGMTTPTTPGPGSEDRSYFDAATTTTPFQAQQATQPPPLPPVPYQANYCICLTFVYRCGHPVDDLRSSPSGNRRNGSLKGKHMICGWACTKEGGCRHTRVTHAVQVPLEFGCRFTEPCDSGTVVDTTRLCGLGGGGGGGAVEQQQQQLKEPGGGGGGVVGKGPVMEVLLASRGDEWR